MAQVAATAAEQFFLELMNRARLNPTAEAALQGITLNQGLAAGTLDASQRQVLAINPIINQASDVHSMWMRTNNTFSHAGNGGSNAHGRMIAEGYAFTGSWAWGENIAWIGSSGALNINDAVLSMHGSLFKSVKGHRENILNNTFREAGVGISSVGPFTQGTTYANSVTATQNFALSGSNIFVTGVNYTDIDGNNFYSIGEGVGSRTVQLYQNGTAMLNTVSTAAGGYSVATSGSGTIEASFSGGDLTAAMGASFSMGGQNVKIDLVNGNTILSSHSATLTGAALNLTLLGINENSATGNTLNNILKGNDSANSLFGLEGNDTIHGLGGGDSIIGGNGNDVLNGGAGTDTLGGGGGRDVGVFAGLASGATINFAGLTTAVTTAAGGTDTLTNVEVLQFDDRMVVIEDPLTDFNADANSDLLWFRPSDGSAHLWTMDNNTQIGSRALGQIGSDWAIQTTGDFNSDGVSDIAWKNTVTGQFYIWNFANGVQSGSANLGSIGTSWNIRGSGDFNADGSGDIAWRNSDGHIYIYNMNNNAVQSGTSLGIIGSEWDIGGVGDFNGDGTSDLALRRSTDGLVYIWSVSNNAIIDGDNLGALGSNWSIKGTGDFNNDGTDDLLLRNATDGTLYFYFMKNSTIAGSSTLGALGAEWTVEAVSDLNGDFSSDIALKNTSTGQFYIYNINNGALSGSTNLGVIGTDWDLV
jgi:uncharacterized protein YkwD